MSFSGNADKQVLDIYEEGDRMELGISRDMETIRNSTYNYHITLYRFEHPPQIVVDI